MTQCACTYANVVDKRGALHNKKLYIAFSNISRTETFTRRSLLAFCHMLVDAAALTYNQSSSAHPDDRRLNASSVAILFYNTLHCTVPSSQHFNLRYQQSAVSLIGCFLAVLVN
jgi:hypothetical protein